MKDNKHISSEVEQYLLNNSIEQIIADKNHVQEMNNQNNYPLKKWFDYLRLLEKDGDQHASYVYSTALRYFQSDVVGVGDYRKREKQSTEELYNEENMKLVKFGVLKDLEYMIKHSRGEERDKFKDLDKKLEKYQIVL